MSTVVSSALLLVVPLLFAALGGLLHRASGVVNIGLEGQMLIGAFVGIIATDASGTWYVGVLAAIFAGGISGWMMTLVITRLKANEIIVGLGFNILVTGIIGFILKWKMGVSGTYRIEGLDRIPRWEIPGISEVPVLRELFSGKDLLFVIAVVLVPIWVWLLRHTRYGLRVRAAGDAPEAAESLGVHTKRLRESAGFIAGALAAIGGAYLSLAQVGLFNLEMIAGRGFIALAAFFFGRSRPVPTALACLLFSVFDAVQVSLQTGSAFGGLLTTLPYVAVVVALALSGYQQKKRARKVATV